MAKYIEVMSPNKQKLSLFKTIKKETKLIPFGSREENIQHL